jgi:hypothetical protein
MHAIVSKLVHELEAMGVDAIAIFNSYAPKGYQVSDLNQLDYASDSPLGSQLTQPYNPDSLTARGGRVAEQGAVDYSGPNAGELDKLIKDSKWDKLKAAIRLKKDSKDSKDLLQMFRDYTKLSQKIDDETLYQKLKNK